MLDPNPADIVVDMRDVAFASIRDPLQIVAEDITWGVRSGEFWVIGGLQGSGKSDFLMMLAGLQAPVRGTYTLFGEQMPLLSESGLPTRLRIGLVFETGQLFNHLTVRENISLPIRYHRNWSREQVAPDTDQILEMLDLTPFADSTPGAITRSWQKRVGLGRALALKPEVLLVDNPLAGLDLRHLQWWVDFLCQLSAGHPFLDRKPATIIASAADLGPWRKCARNWAVLRDKRLFIAGAWFEIGTTPPQLLRELLAFPEL